MGIFENAIDAIDLGLENYKSSDERRILSAIRNLYSGILLLFKHKLSLLSPKESHEVLIKKKISTRINPLTGAIEFVGEGRRTVNLSEIMKRFDGLKIAVDWKRVEQIQEFRNDIEHYHSAASPDAMKKVISDSFIVIRDFMTKHLNVDPKEELDHEAWETMLRINEVYQKEKNDCIATLSQIDWESGTLSSALSECICMNRDSGLISVKSSGKFREDTEFECRSCGGTYEFREIAVAALDNFDGWRSHLSIAGSGDPLIIDCSNCGKVGYVLVERKCAICSEGIEHTCQKCGGEIPTSELGIEGGYCGWCDHMSQKDD